ncbi:hypothetical protein BGZ72_005690 [Mortierella alpina]|nr:hypothetical protein BGZ72_005690 [Mortierella alpina]
MSPTQFQEAYALNPAERPQLVKTATPGTEEHHIYRLRYLSQQLQTGELPTTPQTIADATALLEAAEKSGVCHDFEQLEQLKTQIALLAFPVKPDILRKMLPYDSSMANVEPGQGDAGSVSEDDEAQSTDGLSKLPVALDQTLLDTELLTEKLLDKIESDVYSVSFSRDEWPHLLAQPRMETIIDNLDPDQLCHLFGMDFLYSPKSLEILGKADTSRMDQVVVKIIVRLYQAKKIDFSHTDLGLMNLTWSQLMSIKQEQPQVMNDEAFVGLLEKRIIPEPFAEKEEIAYEDWLSRMMAFVDELSPKFNRHKLAVYLLSLEYDLSKGIANQRFLASRYVSIPRDHPQYNQKVLDTVERELQVNLSNYQSLAYWSERVSIPTAARDEEVIKEYLSRFMLQEQSFDGYDDYFEVKDFLNPLLARVMLMSGDKDITKWSGLLSSHESVSQLAEQTILKFAPDNQVKFLPAENVAFKLRAKNAKRILVRVFEVKTFEYLQQYGDSVMGKNLNLDGLTPNWEHNITLDRPSMELHDVVIELSELVNRRGAFVMDVISNGENSCAYFTKGCLDFVERQSVAGHVLTILDENQEVLSEKCSVWLNGYYYKPNGDGNIIVPYRKQSSSSSSSIYLIHDGFTTRRAFQHRVEDYSIKLACHIDHESIVVGATAKVLIKPTVLIAGTVACPVSLLEQVQLTIQSNDTNGISTTNTVSDFKIHDVDWSEYNFQVPANLARISVILDAKIKVISTGEYQDLHISRDFNFGRPEPDRSVYFMNSDGLWDNKLVSGEIVSLLRKRHDGYRILVVGKNGEPRTNIPLEFKISHIAPVEPLETYLRTDDNGEIFLGPLQGIDMVVCGTTGAKWQISEYDAYEYPSDIHSVVGEVVSLPLARQDTMTIRTVALYSVTGSGSSDRCVLEDCTSKIRLEGGLLTIRGLQAGYYCFKIGTSVSCRLVIAPAKATKAARVPGLEEYLVGSNPMLELLDCTKAPLHMAKPEINAQEQTVDIQLYNWTLDTRFCVVATKFLPIDGAIFKKLKVLDAEVPWAMEKSKLTPTSYKTGRVLGEEYQYILNRKARSTHWAGNLLTKPSALLSPWSIADTAMSEQRMIDTQVMNETCAMPMAMMHETFPRECMKLSRRCTSLYDQSPPLLNFFARPSVVLTNLKPDPVTGLVRLPLSSFQESTFIQVFATDGHQSVQRSTALRQHPSDGPEFQKKDLRFKSALDHTKHYIGERTGIDLDPKLQPGASENAPASIREATITLASNMSAPSLVRVVNSVGQVYDLMLTLLESESDKENLRKFSFIKDWHRLSTEAKKEKYSKWNCHELNLFLYKKDRAFFDAAVAPFLKNKMLKSFMDEYFVGASLQKYVALDQFSMLTSMEKCLLAQRVPGLRPAVVRWIKDRAQNARAASNVKLFNTVMNSGNLKESTSGGESGGEGAAPGKAVQYSATSPAYSPTSPSYSPISTSEEVGATYEMVDDFVGAMGAACSAPAPGNMRMLMASDGDHAASDSVSNSFAKKKKKFTAQRAMAERTLQSRFKPVDLTKEMAETYYYSRDDIVVHDDQSVSLFWLDLAQWDDSKGSSFLSQNFIANAGSFTDAMATIALLDVIFRPKEATLNRASDHSLVVSTLSPAVVFHSSTKELAETPAAGSVLVTQQYFDQTEKEEYDEVRMINIRKYIQPGADFRPLKSYGAHVVLMNATPNPMRVHLEVQIPQGAISIYDGLEARQDIQLQSHGTFQYEYGFYFPEQGDFPHYPAHVSNYEDIVAYAPASVLKVRAPEPDHKDLDSANSWSNVVKHGSKSDILSKLESSPLSSVPEDLLYSRLIKDKKFLQQVTSILRSRQEFNERIWSAALLTQSCELVQELLMHKATIDLDVGFWFTSSSYVRRPQSRSAGFSNQSFRYLEYFPLINARAHKATRNATILNDKFKDQYDRFLRLLSQKPHHEADDLLMLIVYLLAQDRIHEAKQRFQQLSAMMLKAGGPGQQEFFQQLQYDYLWAYLSLCVEVQTDTSASGLGLDLAGVREILDKYRDYPVERWSKMFKDMQQYVDEIEQSITLSSPPMAGMNEGVTTKGAGQEEEKDDVEVEQGGPEVPVSVDFKIGSDSVVAIRHRGVREVTVEYYSIDAETMFSASPLTFSDQGESESSSSGGSGFDGTGSNSDDSSNSYRLVKPNGLDTHIVKCAVRNEGILMIPILPQYLNTNVMISVTTVPPAATRTWKAYYSQTILLQCLEQTGTVKVISKSDGRPIRGGYVKVYAEMKPGSGATTSVFWKDGYTDLVGRFAYAQVSTAAGAAVAGSSSSEASTKSALENVKRFAVFVDGGREGCVVKTLPVPPV